MSKIIIGIDPDSKAHGVAVYIDSKLITLQSKTLLEIYETLVTQYIPMEKSGEYTIEVHIEDVCAVSNSCFHWKPRDSKYVKAKKSEHIGLCKQSQIELERLFEYFHMKIVKHKISKLWKSTASKAQFEKVTGWKGRSNEDTRSAAYFGWLGCK